MWFVFLWALCNLLSPGSQIDFLRWTLPYGKRKTDEAKRGARRSQNQFTPLGALILRHIFFLSIIDEVSFKNKIESIKYSYNDLEILQLIHHIFSKLDIWNGGGWVSGWQFNLLGWSGKEEAAIRPKFLKMIKICFESPLLPSHSSPWNHCHPERIHPSHYRYLRS